MELVIGVVLGVVLAIGVPKLLKVAVEKLDTVLTADTSDTESK